MGVKMTKERILAKLRAEHDALLEVLAQVPPNQMTEPHFEGGWSVKDLLAHITLWERRTLGRIQATLREEPLPPFFPGDADRVNAQAYAANRDRPLAEIEADFHRTFQELLDQVEGLRQEDLDDPRRFPWTRRVPVKRYLNGDGYGHYAEHARQIRAWLESRASSE
jgi:uncharacterized protein (TIGR03083 family)